MKTTSSLLTLGAALAVGLAPLSAFAGGLPTPTDVTADEVMQAIDGRGGGISYPGPYGNGITVDASVTKEVTPDYVAVNGYCEVSNLDDRTQIRTALAKIYDAVKAGVGSDGRVRKAGTPSVYPYYDPYGGTANGRMSGSMNLVIRMTNTKAAQRVSDLLDDNGCSASWDVRLTDVETYESGLVTELLAKVNKRKAVFEKILGKKLKTVSGVSLSTWIDGWSSYDPATNKADATTTLSITFDLGNGATIATPKG